MRAARTVPALVTALNSGDERYGGSGYGDGVGGGVSLRVVAGTSLRAAAAVPRMLESAVRSGAAVAALRGIERFPLPDRDPRAGTLAGARDSVLTLWVLLTTEQPCAYGGAVSTYDINSTAVPLRPMTEDAFHDVTALCPSLTGRAMVSLISLLTHIAETIPAETDAEVPSVAEVVVRRCRLTRSHPQSARN